MDFSDYPLRLAWDMEVSWPSGGIPPIAKPVTIEQHSAGKAKTIHPSDNKIQVLPLFSYDEETKCEIF
jgi:hypothetical protein